MKTLVRLVFLAAILCFFSPVHAQVMSAPIKPVMKHSVFAQGWVNLGFDFEVHPLGGSVLEDGTVQPLVGYLVFEYDF